MRAFSAIRCWRSFTRKLQARAAMRTSMTELFQLRCRECGRLWGNIPRSYCEECLAPLEITYDYAALRGRVTRESIEARAGNLWRYRDLLPLPENFESDLPTGFTPLVRARRLGASIGCGDFYVKKDPVCFPSFSFKVRGVAV